jgi:hypothetical protein
VVLLNYKKKCENLLINDKLFMQKTSFCSKKIKKKFFKSSNTTIFVRALFYWCYQRLKNVLDENVKNAKNSKKNQKSVKNVQKTFIFEHFF